jgi:hypothetical protein
MPRGRPKLTLKDKLLRKLVRLQKQIEIVQQELADGKVLANGVQTTPTEVKVE